MRFEEEVCTPWQRMEVWRGRDEVEFRVAGAAHAWWHRHRLVSGYAWDLLTAACLLVPHRADRRAARPPLSVLMLGLGGGTSLRLLKHLVPDARITAVEIDGEMTRLARRHMELDALGVEVVHADARQWVASCRSRFDVIVDDLYLAGDDDVYRVGTLESHWRKLQGLLSARGLLAANLVTGCGHRTVQSAMRRRFCAAFPVVRSLATPASLNETLVGGCKVEGRAALTRAGRALEHPEDVRLWKAMTLRTLASVSLPRRATST